eukprot:131749_1
MRWDHGQGQKDNFCFMNIYLPIPCQLYFDPSGILFVNYPTRNFCCQLCPVGQFCTVLKPDWIQSGTYDGTQNIMNGILLVIQRWIIGHRMLIIRHVHILRMDIVTLWNFGTS